MFLDLFMALFIFSQILGGSCIVDVHSIQYTQQFGCQQHRPSTEEIDTKSEVIIQIIHEVLHGIVETVLFLR